MNAALLADIIGVIHALIVLFVVGGQALILAGWALGWGWTRHVWFRRVHLITIAVIMAIAAMGEWCPLTVWESELRQESGQAGYDVGFIETWLHKLMYFEAPLWVFTIAYAAFTALVAWCYWKYPPRARGGNNG